MVIHLDPVQTDDEVIAFVNGYGNAAMGSAISMLIFGRSNDIGTKLLFDVVVPIKANGRKRNWNKELQTALYNG